MAEGPSKRSRTRRLIVERASELLRDGQGWNKVTLDEIAQQAGVVKTTLFNHFPGGKTDILMAVWDSWVADVERSIDALPDEVRYQNVAIDMVMAMLQGRVGFARLLLDDFLQPTFRLLVNRLTDVLNAALLVGRRSSAVFDDTSPDLGELLTPHVLRCVISEGSDDAEARLVYSVELRDAMKVINAYLDTPH